MQRAMIAPGAPIALTMGEPAGVAPEITLKAYAALKDQGASFFVIGDPALYGEAAARISAPHEARAAFTRALPVLPLDEKIDVEPGRPSAANAKAVIASIETAVRFALSGEAAAIVTNPIQKSALLEAGFKFPGHTEFLGALTAGAAMPAGMRTRGPVMMIAGPALRTVPVTIHQSVREAAASLSTAMIVKTALVVIEALKNDFGVAAPRLAISGLNPHAGEQGAMGAEDRDIIAPAIAELCRNSGAEITGPHPADTLFHAAARAKYDAALCMLHDQALIPAKTLAFDEAVNVTLGLPVIRTSPDHGTALDIAGKNLANPASLIEAIKLAARMAAARAVR
ncbi:MAG: 4-hydroxythreonine-4-phosphate dehydrogenase PdxA [Parvularculaceae bacterium]